MDPNCTEPWHLKILFLISFSLSIQSTIIILYFTLNSTTTTLVMPRRTFINPQNTGLNLTPTSLKLGESNHVILSDPRPHLRLIYISGDGLGYGLRFGFLFCTEIGSRNEFESVQCEMFCRVQCRHWVRNPSSSM